MRRAPRFWATGGPRSWLLAPVAWIWGWQATRRLRRPPVARLSVPVICIGNYVAGGAGKTPTAIAIAAMARAAGLSPLFLSRGYGGETRGPLLVDPSLHTAGQVGDEPMLLARHAPVIVARDRAAASPFVEVQLRELGADLVILDDGFQNPSLRKDLNIVVIDAAFGTGNGRVMPAGPLRAPLFEQVRRTDLLVSIGDGAAAIAAIRMAARRAVPIARAELAPVGADALAGLPVIAFAGIGRPEKFAATLRAAGARIDDFLAFPDHHRFTDREALQLLDRADRLGAALITTEKDAARLAAATAGPRAELHRRCRTLAVRLAFLEPSRVDQALAATFAEARARRRAG
ncbi:MAG: tetraacyldisaccharide 4'-kinase [Hyphomicrobiaceae bacterium]|nr:tetraacyldisaccharide 4'-kinase [Hyphomicrobiaceae bacterium]